MEPSIININDWIGPLMAAGALFTGAALLIGESLWTKHFAEEDSGGSCNVPVRPGGR